MSQGSVFAVNPDLAVQSQQVFSICPILAYMGGGGL